jgi:hypothetical protein
MHLSIDLSEKFEAEKSTVSWVEEGIVRVHFKSNSLIFPSDQLEFIELQKKLTRGKPHAVLFTSGKSVNFSLESRENAVVIETSVNSTANATVVNNIFVMAMAGIYSSFYKLKKPYKVFSSEKDALVWLRKHLKKEHETGV